MPSAKSRRRLRRPLDPHEVESTLADVPTKVYGPFDEDLVDDDDHPAYCGCTAWRVHPGFDAPSQPRFNDWFDYFAQAARGDALVFAVSFAGPKELVGLIHCPRPRAPWIHFGIEQLSWSRLDGTPHGGVEVGMDTGVPLTLSIAHAMRHWCPVLARPRPAIPLDELRRRFDAIELPEHGLLGIASWAELLDDGRSALGGLRHANEDGNQQATNERALAELIEEAWPPRADD